MTRKDMVFVSALLTMFLVGMFQLGRLDGLDAMAQARSRGAYCALPGAVPMLCPSTSN